MAPKLAFAWELTSARSPEVGAGIRLTLTTSISIYFPLGLLGGRLLSLPPSFSILLVNFFYLNLRSTFIKPNFALVSGLT